MLLSHCTGKLRNCGNSWTLHGEVHMTVRALSGCFSGALIACLLLLLHVSTGKLGENTINKQPAPFLYSIISAVRLKCFKAGFLLLVWLKMCDVKLILLCIHFLL